MAKFVNVTTPNDKHELAINVDLVAYVQQSTADHDKCTVFFDGERSLTLGMSKAVFVGLAKE